MKVSEPECDATYHRFYSLEPFGVQETGEILIVSVCSNCGKPIEYRTKI